MKAVKTLEKGLSELGLELSPQPFITYLELMQKWNKAINLTAITELREMVVKHVLDSLSIVPVLQQYISEVDNPSLLDIGSGGGLPGIPLALAMPSLSVNLCESIGKKCAFLTQAKQQLDLKNITVFNQRAEDLALTEAPTLITARAVASIDTLYAITKHLSDKHTIWMLMKSHDEQWSPSAENHLTCSTLDVSVPLLNAKRQLVILTQ